MWSQEVEYIEGKLTKGGCHLHSLGEFITHAAVGLFSVAAVWGSPVLLQRTPPMPLHVSPTTLFTKLGLDGMVPLICC